MNCSVIAELRQWSEWIKANPAASLLKAPIPEYSLITDAAPQGWGATLSKLEKPIISPLPNQAPENLQVQPYPSRILTSTSLIAYGTWRRSERDMTSNKKELIAIDKALEVFQPKLETLRCRHILIQSDNTTAVYNINRKAAASSLYLDLRHTLERAEKLDVKLTAVHIPGVENTTTDSLSRLELSGDYQIKKAVIWPALQKINFRPNVDLFARQSNSLLPTYCSLKKVKEAKKSEAGIPENRLGNAFHINWNNLNPILHPPIPLILKSLEKFRAEGQEAAIILPDWKGQAWSSLLRKLSVKKVTLGPSEKVLKRGNLMIKRDLKLPPGKMCLHLLRSNQTLQS
jgi:hypothetical protein